MDPEETLDTHGKRQSSLRPYPIHPSEPSAFRGDYRNIGRCIRHLMVSPSSIHGLSHPRRRCVHHVGRHCRYLDAGKANYRALDFLGNRKPRFRISLLPSGLVSNDATLFLLCDTSHCGLLQLAEERGRVLIYNL